MKKIINEAAHKIMIQLSTDDESELEKELEVLSSEWVSIIECFPNLKDVLPMTHTINIDDVILRSDEPVPAPELKELFKNATHVKGREIEVPKVVG